MRSRGGGARQRKKNRAAKGAPGGMVFMEEGETIYGQVVNPLGFSRFNVICTDTVMRQCKLKGSMCKTVWIQPNDIVLVSLRNDEKNSGDICYKYPPQETKILRENNHIPENFREEAEAGRLEFDFQRI